MHANPYPPRASTAAPGVSPGHSINQGFSETMANPTRETTRGTSHETPRETPETTRANRPLRAVAATNLRRGRHLRAVRDCGPTEQLDLFAAGCDQHGTPAGQRCELCLDQLDLFGPGGDVA